MTEEQNPKLENITLRDVFAGIVLYAEINGLRRHNAIRNVPMSTSELVNHIYNTCDGAYAVADRMLDCKQHAYKQQVEKK